MLTFSGYIKDYQPAVPTRNEGYDVMSLGAMIYANGAENIGLTGRGHIVGPSTDCEIYQENRKYLVVEECVDVTKPIAERLCDGQQGHPVLLPMTVAPVHCKNVLIEGITIDQGLFWNIVPQYCDNVVIRGVTVNSAGHGRTDGIDIESTTNSLIEYCQLTPEFKNIYIKDFTVDGCQRLIDVKALPERPLTNVLIENFEGHGKDFLRLQDVSGFVLKGGKIHTAAPSAVLDGCQSVMLLDLEFNGKQLKQITNNATLYVTQSCLSSKFF